LKHVVAANQQRTSAPELLQAAVKLQAVQLLATPVHHHVLLLLVALALQAAAHLLAATSLLKKGTEDLFFCAFFYLK
jgi:hypothetical protein